MLGISCSDSNDFRMNPLTSPAVLCVNPGGAELDPALTHDAAIHSYSTIGEGSLFLVGFVPR